MNWIISGLIGVIIGLILGVVIDRDTVNKYFNKIRKVKVKNSENVSDLITIDQLKEKLKTQKQKKRAERRARRKGVV